MKMYVCSIQIYLMHNMFINIFNEFFNIYVMKNGRQYVTFVRLVNSSLLRAYIYFETVIS